MDRYRQPYHAGRQHRSEREWSQRTAYPRGPGLAVGFWGLRQNLSQAAARSAGRRFLAPQKEQVAREAASAPSSFSALHR